MCFVVCERRDDIGVYFALVDVARNHWTYVIVYSVSSNDSKISIKPMSIGVYGGEAPWFIWFPVNCTVIFISYTVFRSKYNLTQCGLCFIIKNNLFNVFYNKDVLKLKINIFFI